MEPEETVLLVMDPWINSPFEKINKDVAENITEYLLPVVSHAIERNIMVIVLTEKLGLKDGEYNSLIDERLQELVREKKIQILTHQEMDSSEVFAEYLMELGIKNLIYTGFATQMCVLYRPSGIMSIFYLKKENNINIFCIPEATMACVSEKEKDNIVMRNNIMIMLAQNQIARLIMYEDFIAY